MKRKVYTPEFKEKVIRKMHEDGLSSTETAKYFELRHKQIQDWEKIYLEKGFGGFKKPSSSSELIELRIETEYFKKLLYFGYGENPKTHEKIKIITILQETYPLPLILKVLKIPKSTYYYHQKNKNQPDKYHLIKEEIKKIFMEHNGRYGYRRITLELHQRGFIINHKTVLKLMKEIELFCHV